MGWLDSLKKLFNSEVEETYNYLYKYYYKGLKRLTEGRNNPWTFNLSNPSYSNMKMCCQMKDSIIKLHKLVEQNEKIEKAQIELELLRRNYPHAFIFYCNEALGGIIYDSSIKMPGANKSNEKGKLIRIGFYEVRDYSYIYYGNQYKAIPYKGQSSIFPYKSYQDDRYDSIPTSISDLKYSDIEKILKYKHLFKSKEEEIKKILKLETSKIRFQQEIVNNTRRSSFYKEFLQSVNKKEDDIIYLVDHLVDLDSFIFIYIHNTFYKLKEKYSVGLAEYIRSQGLPTSYSNKDLEFLRREMIVTNNEEIKKLDVAKKKYDELRRKYPKGLPAFEKYYSFDEGKNSAELTIEEIVECEDSIAIFEQNYAEAKFYSDWQNKQSEFAAKCRDIYSTYLSGWGCYSYNVPFKAKISSGEFKNKEFKVWQLFCESYTSLANDEFDSFFPCWRKNRENLSSFISGSRTFKNSVYDEILSFIDKLNEIYPKEIQIILANSNEGTDNSLINKHFTYLKQQLYDRNIRTSIFTKSPSRIEEKVHYIVIELITNKKHFSDICDSLLSIKKSCYNSCVKSYKNTCFSNIVYITLLKECDDFEARELVNREKENKRKKEEEQKRKEEIARKAEEERKAADKTKHELKDLCSCVSSWLQPNRSFVKCFSFYYYYPTKCGWEVSEEDWDIRKLIWDFKAKSQNDYDPDLYKHKQLMAQNKVLHDLRFVLSHFFGNNLSKLTFVCLPASTEHATNNRFKSFSELVCRELGMINGFNHICIIKDGISKNDPSNTTGHSIPAEVTLDKEFFKHKNVILFDDVITSGASMERLKRLVENAEGTVIGGISIGKTKHERQNSHPIELLQ